MRFVIRTWTALAVFGAGLIHLAVGAGAPLPMLIAFALLGAAEVVWAAVTLAKRRYPLERAMPALLLLPLAVWALGVAAGTRTAALPSMALIAAGALGIFAAVSVAVHRRRSAPQSPTSEAEPSGWAVVGGLVVGAVVMSAVTLPALGATTAGVAAMNGPHSHHSIDAEFEVDHEGH